MKYIGDYSFTQIEEFFNSDFSVKEKLDGSYLKIGTDANGSFFTQRKGNKICYHVDDWDDLAWTNAFKSAHLIMEQWVEQLETALGNKLYNFSAEVEIINGILPNTIPYDVINKMSIANSISLSYSFPNLKNSNQSRIISREPNDIVIVIHKMSNNDKSFKRIVFNLSMSFMFSSYYIFSNDGINLEKQRVTANGFVIFQNHHSKRKNILETFNAFNGNHAFVIKQEFFDIPVKVLWDLNLSKKPEFISETFWKDHKTEIKTTLSKVRDNIKIRLQDMLFTDINFYFGAKLSIMNNIEGFVLQNEKMIFKVIFPHFQYYNKLTHIVRYWLQDGRRPKRPCFLTRTSTWSKEEKLKRLDTLLVRYQKHKFDLSLSFDPSFNYGTLKQLDQRTLVLFAEIRRDIINGRYCIS